jgi:ATP-dependent protease ClpP protease subunit
MSKNMENNKYITVNEHTLKQYDVFLDGYIDEPQYYRELLSILFNTCEDDHINIYINSSGGELDTAMSIIEGIKHSRAKVTALLIGACHSAASIISMYCPNVIVLDSAYSMIHTASFGSQGMAGNVKSHAIFTVEQIEKLLLDSYDGFLSKEEILKVKSGVELWFDADEIKKRMKNRIKCLEKKFKRESSNE